ncbi:MarC family protein [Rhodobacteraceae bacterium W635]|uniref:MarC family protein n=1 Tax=Nioella halotolerans TaxID=2303578 RepID=UPI000E3DC29B|nr:MarC family protein [Rhodobacteraceae bacterium W635]
MTLATALTAFTALFVVIDPIGLTPIFIALTSGLSARARRVIALRACLVSFLLLTIFGLAGESVLQFLGISLPAFRIAGGILLFLTALDMLFERRKQRREGQADSAPEAEDPSVFPLAMPLIAGPGAIATMILLAGSASTPGEILLIHAIMLVVLACVLALFFLAGGLERLLGAVGINVVTRLLGMLLAALSVQFVIDGLRSLQVV